MADSQRTEKATPQRLRKAREKGDFPAAREFVAALQFLAFVLLAGVYFPSWIANLQNVMRAGLHQAFSTTLTAADLVRDFRRLASVALTPLAVMGCGLLVLTLALQLGTTGFGLSLARLSPAFERLNPTSRL